MLPPLVLGPAAIWNDLELLTWEEVGGSLANTGGVGNIPDSIQSPPTTECAFRTIDPKGKSYANKMWILRLKPDSNRHSFVYTASYLFPTADDIAAAQALENDLQQTLSHNTFNWGWQWEFASEQLRVWNRSAGQWVTTPISFNFQPDKWQRIVYECHRDSKLVYYDAMTLNGQRSAINLHFPLVKIGNDDELNPGVQQDGNESGQKWKVHLDAVSLRAS